MFTKEDVNTKDISSLLKDYYKQIGDITIAITMVNIQIKEQKDRVDVIMKCLQKHKSINIR